MKPLDKATAQPRFVRSPLPPGPSLMLPAFQGLRRSPTPSSLGPHVPLRPFITHVLDSQQGWSGSLAALLTTPAKPPRPPKSSWAVLSSQLTKVLLSHPGSNHPSTLLSSLSRVISSLPTPPTAARPSSIASIPALLAPLIELSPPLPQDPFSALFLLALLSPKSSLANLVPPAMKAELNILVEGALSKGGVRNEVEVLSTQLAALGECTSSFISHSCPNSC